MSKERNLCKCFLYFCLVNLVGSSRILGIVPSASYSHQLVFRPIWRELSKRGHDLVVITTNPDNDPTLNIKEIDISFAYHLWNVKHNYMQKFEDYQHNPYKLMNIIREISLDLCNEELLHPEIQAILKNETEYFDLIIVEYFYPGMFGFAERFQCPFIGVSSFDLPNILFSFQGISTHPAAYPDILLPFQGGGMTFLERLASTFFNVLMITHTWVTGYENEQAFLTRHFGNNVPPIEQLINKVSMIFLNANPAFNVRPLGPTFVNIGDGIHIAPIRPLPEVCILKFYSKSSGTHWF